MFQSLRKAVSTAPRVVHAGHPALRAKTARVAKNKVQDPETKRLVERMVAAMRGAEGCGLAAPQIGVSLQVLVLELTAQTIEADGRARDVAKLRQEPVPLTVLFNPKLRAIGRETVTHREGCLSIPDYSAHVPRALTVEVEALDHKGEEIKWRTTGWAARILQHEVDHLKGSLYIDKMLPESFSFDKERCRHAPPWIDQKNDGAFVRK
eukprot:m.491827 g.491827  ORF g.491827 m.491827 type:complete len:208 (+) comp30804_c0_seq1:76-699(+)